MRGALQRKHQQCQSWRQLLRGNVYVVIIWWCDSNGCKRDVCYMWCRPTNEAADLTTMQAKVDGTVGWPVLPDITTQVHIHNCLRSTHNSC
jgi:hypothetical protein